MKVFPAAAVLLSLASPLAASAQSPSDVAYCNELAQTYRQVVGLSSFSSSSVPEAIARCGSHPEDSIPTLEKALIDNKVTLPKRS